ncbi:hypothetical protein BGZ83_002543 [Gryganskiella cystojenkinii]|nr:hypothetical protein BGZ83_002543 [Gryganskiella cystojenkinii]
MQLTIDIIESVMPLAFSVASVITLYYLSRKSVHLDDRDHSVDNRLDNQQDYTTATLPSSDIPVTETGSVISVDLARLSLTVVQLGLSLYILVLTLSSGDTTNKDDDNDDDNDDKEDAQHEYHLRLFSDLCQILSWSYMLALSFIHLFRRRISHQFWIRLQMDLFYTLEWTLSTTRIFRVFVVLMELPVSKWPLWLKIEQVHWTLVVFLLWTSAVTKPFEAVTQPKSTTAQNSSRREALDTTPFSQHRLDVDTITPTNEKFARPSAKEYRSSIYSQLTFAWVNSLVYLGYKRPVQDVDLPWLEVEDQAWWSIRYFFQKKNRNTSFIRAFVAAVRYDVFVQFLWCVPWCFFMNAAPYCLNKIVQFVECEDCGAPTWREFSWVFALFFSQFLESLTIQAALHKGRRIYVHTVSICNSQIFAKTLRRKDLGSPNKKEEDGKSDGKDDEGHGDGDDDDNDGVKNKDGTLNIANLVAVDLKKMEDCICYLLYVYGFPLQFVLASVQLYWLLGNAALVGVVFIILTFPLPAKLYTTIVKMLKDVMSTKDERMETLNEMLSAIRIVKFFGWEAQFVQKIRTARQKELKQSYRTFVIMLIAEVAWMIMPIVNTIVVFFAYTKIYHQTMSASVIFTTLALMNIMRTAMNFFPQEIITALRTIVSLRRISQFLEEEEIIQDTTVTKINAKAKIPSLSSTPTIGFVNASFVWPNKEHDKATAKAAKKASWVQRIKSKFSKKTTKSSATEEEPVVETATPQERFQLKDISAEFPIGQLSVVVGPTGSGKSALLLALLGELERLDGAMFLPRLDYGPYKVAGRGSGIAYAAQTAWLQNSTIRDNILFGKLMDQDRYDAVLEGCALYPDLETFEAGDKTEIGEQGITLSGGQKQRVALARALYSDASVLLLDDCLSAVDSHTGKHLFQTLTGPLVENRTVILVTHQVQLTLNAAKFVLVLSKGEVLGAGTPEEAVTNGWIDNVALAGPISDEESQVSTLDETESNVKKYKKTGAHENKKAATKLTEDEKKVEGSVTWRIYKTYLVASGGMRFWSVMLTLYLMRLVVDISQSAWLAIWANKLAGAVGALVRQGFNITMPVAVSQTAFSAFTPRYGLGSKKGELSTLAFVQNTNTSVSMASIEDASVDYYLGIYVLIAVFSMAFVTLVDFASIFGALRASTELHDQLLYKISRAKLRFFDTTPIGRITNRFSSDISTIDDDVMRGLLGFLLSLLSACTVVFIISVNTPAFLLAALFIVVIYAVIGSLYVPISRDLKRLNSNSKSPILNHFNETLTGLATIRAFGFEDRFRSRNLVTVDDNNRTFFLLWSTNRWLHWRVDITGAIVSFVSGMLILKNWESVAPGWAALSLTSAVTFTGNIVWLIRIYAENEMNMNAVERVAEYMDLEEEPPAIIEGSRPRASWPDAGEIIVDHLTMKYSEDSPEVIKDISFEIKAGEKVGVVGRTGSGKSTFAISLFRFMDPAKGSISIDGIDICSIGLQDLRSKLTIIPQDPILFKGTLRSNLDPFGEREDHELLEALRRSHLIPETRSNANSIMPSRRNSQDISPEEAASASASAAATFGKSPGTSLKGSTSGSSEIVDPSKITLDTPVKENGSNFSQGQRQLIALARALVRQSKIIVMDEATASVDFETDLKIQTTIREEMADSTIITIAHRIRTIADFDRVLVMNAGEIAEYDTPFKLMNKEDGLFRSMCERSSEFEALYAIAEEKARRELSNGSAV